jgi:hypothetical protein
MNWIKSGSQNCERSEIGPDLFRAVCQMEDARCIEEEGGIAVQKSCATLLELVTTDKAKPVSLAHDAPSKIKT